MFDDDEMEGIDEEDFDLDEEEDLGDVADWEAEDDLEEDPAEEEEEI